MKRAFIFAICFMLAGCQAYQEEVVQPAGPLPPQEPTSPLQAKVILVGIQILAAPDVLISGEPASFTWQVENGQVVEHTNIHTSFTSDFAERIDTEKQSGTSGEYSDTLTLESAMPKTVYIRAHANIDGDTYQSDVIMRELRAAPANAEMQGAQNVNAEIAGFKFNPATIRVKAGDTIVWTQQDSTPHTVTSVSGSESFDSGSVRGGQTFSHTFNTPGTYEYECSIHPSMRGTVVVS